MDALEGAIVIISVFGAILTATLTPYLTHKYQTKHDRDFAIVETLWGEKYQDLKELSKALYRLSGLLVDISKMQSFLLDENVDKSEKFLILDQVMTKLSLVHDAEKPTTFFSTWNKSIASDSEKLEDAVFKFQNYLIKRRIKLVHERCFGLVLIVNDIEVINKCREATKFAEELFGKMWFDPNFDFATESEKLQILVAKFKARAYKELFTTKIGKRNVEFTNDLDELITYLDESNLDEIMSELQKEGQQSNVCT